MPRPAVVLVRPQQEGNVGSVARAMANMGLDELILVEPAAELGTVARQFSVNAWPIVEVARHVSSLAEALAPFERVVGTTATRGRTFAGPLVGPGEIARLLAAEPEAPTALVFGPETSGLTAAELAVCGWVVRIPTDAALPTLNLGQAVLLLAYELFLARAGEDARGASAATPAITPTRRSLRTSRLATTAEVEGLFAQAGPVLRQVGFARDSSFRQVMRDLRSLAGRSRLTGREVAILRGILRRTAWRLAQPDGDAVTGETP